MLDSISRDREEKLYDLRVVETVKALIEVYRSAFAKEWVSAFSQTVKVQI
jgi:hypothetical protein